MSHTALVNGVLLGLLTVMILLLVMCIIAVVLAPAQPPGSGDAHGRHDSAPPSRRPPASLPSVPFPRRPPSVTAPAAGLYAAPIADEETTGLGAPFPLMHDWIPRPEVSGGPPWEPAPKPPGLDG
jgi:hypothetical protein